MPRRKTAPYVRMVRTVVCVPFEQWKALAYLGAGTAKKWPSYYIPELTPSFSRGVRRAFALVEPLLAAETAKYKAAYEARAAARQKWLDGEEERYKRSEDRERKAFYEEQDLMGIRGRK